MFEILFSIHKRKKDVILANRLTPFWQGQVRGNKNIFKVGLGLILKKNNRKTNVPHYNRLTKMLS